MANPIEQKIVPAGGQIFAEGDAGGEAYVLESGRIVVFKTVNGQEVILGTVDPGGILGEMGLLDGQPRMASARADLDCTLRIIPKAKLEAEWNKTPKAVKVIISALLGNVRLLGAELAEAEAVSRGQVSQRKA